MSHRSGTCQTPTCTNPTVPGYAYCETCLRRRGGVVGPSGPVTPVPVPALDPVSTIRLPPMQTTYQPGDDEGWNMKEELAGVVVDLRVRLKRLNNELHARKEVIQQQKVTIARLVWACSGPPEGDWLDSLPGDFKPRTEGYDLMWGKLDPETGQVQTWQWFRA